MAGELILVVGYTSPGSSSLVRPGRLRRLEAFREGLRELGYVEGQNVVVEARCAEGQYARYPALVGDLVRRKASVIVTVGGGSAKAAKQGTSTIPIIKSNFTQQRAGCWRCSPPLSVALSRQKRIHARIY